MPAIKTRPGRRSAPRARVPKTYKQWVEENPLRAFRRTKRRPGKHVAIELGTTATSMQNWEFGLVRPNPVNMAKIAAYMGESQVDLESAWTLWMRDKPEGR